VEERHQTFHVVFKASPAGASVGGATNTTARNAIDARPWKAR